MDNDQNILLVISIAALTLILFLCAWSAGVRRSRRFQSDLPIHYFRPSACDHPPHPGAFQGRGTTGRWSRGLVRDFFTANLKIEWNYDLVQSSIDRLEAERNIEFHVLAMKPFVVTNYQKAIEEFQRQGLAHNGSRRGALLFIDMDERAFTLLLDVGLLPHLDKDALALWGRLIEKDFGQGNYSGGIIDLAERLEET